MLISKDYVFRDEKDESILHYQALVVCYKQRIKQYYTGLEGASRLFSKKDPRCVRKTG